MLIGVATSVCARSALAAAEAPTPVLVPTDDTAEAARDVAGADGPKSALPDGKPAPQPSSEPPSPTAPALPAVEPAGDLVESIGDSSDGDTSGGPPVASRAAAVPDRFELRGWVRQSFELGFDPGGVNDASSTAEALPYDRLVERSQLFMAARYSHGKFFEADLSGLLEYAAREQGPRAAGSHFNLFNGQGTNTDLVTSMREFFVAFFWKEFDFRIGQQRVAWGRADFISPNDVINARDGRDPFIGETELRAIPTVAVRGDANLPFGTFELVWSPVYVPDRADVTGSNWAGLQPQAPAILRRFANSSSADRGLAIATPTSDLSQSALGARFSWSARGFDVSHYYHYGFDGPFIALDRSVATTLGTSDLGATTGDDVTVLNQAAESSTPPLQVRFLRRHHVGLDAGTTLGPFGLRLDAAYQSSRAFFQRDLLSFASPTVLGVASLEYQTGEREKGIVLEALYLRVLERPPTKLLSYARDTSGVAAIVRWKLVDPLSFEVRAMLGIYPATQVLQPTLTARFESLSLSLGALWLSGERYSYGGYYSRNREVFAKAKYSF